MIPSLKRPSINCPLVIPPSVKPSMILPLIVPSVILLAVSSADYSLTPVGPPYLIYTLVIKGYFYCYNTHSI